MTAILEVENLVKSFGGVHAIRDLSLSIEEGESRAITASEPQIWRSISLAHSTPIARCHVDGVQTAATMRIDTPPNSRPVRCERLRARPSCPARR